MTVYIPFSSCKLAFTLSMSDREKKEKQITHWWCCILKVLTKCLKQRRTASSFYWPHSTEHSELAPRLEVPSGLWLIVLLRSAYKPACRLSDLALMRLSWKSDTVRTRKLFSFKNLWRTPSQTYIWHCTSNLQRTEVFTSNFQPGVSCENPNAHFTIHVLSTFQLLAWF